ncbi:hypothetical protein CDD83_9907 [Cordyceps sp. RAO-2017]|nr:hypothetical protein CDD83_9907 [Cordyceps sp. RAO-2017]
MGAATPYRRASTPSTAATAAARLGPRRRRPQPPASSTRTSPAASSCGARARRRHFQAAGPGPLRHRPPRRRPHPAVARPRPGRRRLLCVRGPAGQAALRLPRLGLLNADGTARITSVRGWKGVSWIYGIYIHSERVQKFHTAFR